MSGYNGFAKSNNAVDAESDGRFPASAIEKALGLPAGFVKAECRFASDGEWHHTSGWYNKTPYFAQQAIECWMKGEAAEEFEIPEARFADAVARYKAAKKQAVTLHENVRVRWLEWSGSRNHPKAKAMEVQGCTVEDKGGAMVTVVLPDGRRFNKGKKTNGFEVARLNEDGSKVRIIDNLGWRKP